MLILIDADPIVYRCGFAAEKTSWHITYEGPVDDTPQEIEFASDEKGTAGEYMKEWMKFNDTKGIAILDKQKVITPDPLSYALRAVKVQVESIMEECESEYREGCKMLMWLSGGKNYRDDIAKVRPYKGNRDPLHKPVHYQSIRDYLRAQYRSFMTSGVEADDAVSIFAHNYHERGIPERLVIATIDKDLDQIPGLHYNYMQKVHYAITPTEAERFFVYQILAGDATDNIVGVWRCGDTAANRIASRFSYTGRVHDHTAGTGTLGRGQRKSCPVAAPAGDDGVAGCPEQPTLDGYLAEGIRASTGEQRPHAGADGSDAEHADTGLRADAVRARPASASTSAAVSGAGELRSTSVPRVRAPNWWPAVVAEYANSQRKAGCPYAQDNPETIAVEMAQLVHLQEYPGQLWHPHGDLVVSGFGEEDFD